MNEPHDEIASASPRSPWEILAVWLAIGMQSFGGGVATLTLIRRTTVERFRWMTDEEFVRDWAICQLAPGINLLAMTILIGRRAAGVKGIALALTGLLLPSAAVTILLTALYAHIRHALGVGAAIRGVVPATVGLGLVTSWQMARPILERSRREGADSLGWSLLLVGASGAATLGHASTTAVLLAAAAAGALVYWGRTALLHRWRDPEPKGLNRREDR